MTGRTSSQREPREDRRSNSAKLRYNCHRARHRASGHLHQWTRCILCMTTPMQAAPRCLTLHLSRWPWLRGRHMMGKTNRPRALLPDRRSNNAKLRYKCHHARRRASGHLRRWICCIHRMTAPIQAAPRCLTPRLSRWPSLRMRGKGPAALRV